MSKVSMRPSQSPKRSVNTQFSPELEDKGTYYNFEEEWRRLLPDERNVVFENAELSPRSRRLPEHEFAIEGVP